MAFSLKEILLVTLLHILVFGRANGIAIFRNFPLEPRIYPSAAVGVRVGQIVLYETLTGVRGGQYSIKPSKASPFFAIDHNSGAIVIAKAINVFLGQGYDLQVNGVLHGNKLITNIRIVMSGKNTAKPVFQERTYRFPVHDKGKPGTFIGDVVATTSQPQRYHCFEYTTQSTNVPFTVEKSTGNIYLSEFSSVPTGGKKFRMKIRAAESANRKVFSETTVVITVASFYLECYKCKTKDRRNACAMSPTDKTDKTKCFDLLGKCVIQQTTNNVTGDFALERDCEHHVPFFGDKTKCFTKDDTRTCQVICDKTLCNDVATSNMEQYVMDNGAWPLVTSQSILSTAVAAALLISCHN